MTEHTPEYEAELKRINSTFDGILNDFDKKTKKELAALLHPKLGRWFYCKYCYKSIRPEIGDHGSLVVCPSCGYGLAPLIDVAKAGSLKAWYEGIVRAFNEENGTHET